jgi:DMSO/TMAO reductase YedYZ heme-binding membrane subunit
MPDLDTRSEPTRLARGALRTPWLEGSSLTLLVAAVIASLALAIVLAGAASADALGLAIRLTARTSFTLFVAAFTAAALHRLWPGPFTRWQRRNRRYLGLAFAASHATHAAAIVTLAVLHPAAFHDHTRAMNPIPGVVAYVVLAAMTATSFDRTAAWLGRRAWNALHTVGSLYLWGAFLNAFLVRARHAPGYWIPVGLAVAAMALRIIAWAWAWARRRGRPHQT